MLHVINRKWTSVAAAMAAACASFAAQAQAEVVTQEARITPIAAFGAYAAWSHYDGRAYRLVVWRDGVARSVPIRPRQAPFDADLGADEHGRIVVVYSRCRTIEPPGPRDTVLAAGVENKGCDLYRYDVAARRERRLARPSRVGTSEFLPAIAGRRLVFARRGSRPRLPQLISATLDRYAERRLPRPSGFAFTELDGGNVGPLTLDVAGDRAVVGWQHLPEPGACGDEASVVFPTNVVALYDLNARRRQVIDDDCLIRRGGGGFFGPSLDDRFAYYGFDAANQPDDTWSVRRVELASGALLDTPISTTWLRSTQSSGGWVWTVTDAPGHGFAITRTAAPPS